MLDTGLPKCYTIITERKGDKTMEKINKFYENGEMTIDELIEYLKANYSSDTEVNVRRQIGMIGIDNINVTVRKK